MSLLAIFPSYRKLRRALKETRLALESRDQQILAHQKQLQRFFAHSIVLGKFPRIGSFIYTGTNFVDHEFKSFLNDLDAQAEDKAFIDKVKKIVNARK